MHDFSRFLGYYGTYDILLFSILFERQLYEKTTKKGATFWSKNHFRSSMRIMRRRCCGNAG